jgi:hypothetical protein
MYIEYLSNLWSTNSTIVTTGNGQTLILPILPLVVASGYTENNIALMTAQTEQRNEEFRRLLMSKSASISSLLHTAHLLSG